MAELTQAYRWQAWVHFRQDRYAESIALCERALAIVPTDNALELAAIYNILASCYGNSGIWHRSDNIIAARWNCSAASAIVNARR